jgi:gliding motility-associated-like protein
LPLCSSSGIQYSILLTSGSSYLWTVPDDAVITSGSAGPDNNQISVDFGIHSGNITVTETNLHGCQGLPVQLAVELQGCDLVANFTASDTDICLDETVTFTDHSEGTTSGTIYQWEFGDGAEPATAALSGSQVVTYSTPGLKTVRLIITDVLSDTLVRTDYIMVNPAPVAVLENAERCGPGSIDIVASLPDADKVYFSVDGGATVADSDDVAPYIYTADVVESETIQVWGRAYNTTTGCYGSWGNPALGISNAVPVTEEIASSRHGNPPAGYLDAVCQGDSAGYFVLNSEPGAIYNWNIPGLLTAQDTSEIGVKWDVPVGDYSIEVQKISASGCPGSVSEARMLVSKPSPDLGEDVKICEGNTYTFELTESYSSYEWNDLTTGPTLTVSTSGKVYVTVKDDYGCAGSDTAMLVISSNPVVNLGKDTVICGDYPLQLDAGDFATYHWSTGETINPITVHEGAGIVSVTVTNEDGCEGSDAIVIGDCNPEILLGTVPNTITPNHDQVHDSWEIKKIYLFPDADIQIFDRWGRIVFKTYGGYDNNWQGTDLNGNDLPVDTYYYIIDLKVKDYAPITGNVTIIR